MKQALGHFVDSALLVYRKISPGSKKRAEAPTQQMQNFMDIVDLKQLMERVLDHFVSPICAIIRRRHTIRTLFAFRSFAHDPQGVLAAVHGLALVGVELCLNIGILELRVAPFAYADGRRGLFHDPQFALCHDCSLAHPAGRA